MILELLNKLFNNSAIMNLLGKIRAFLGKWGRRHTVVASDFEQSIGEEKEAEHCPYCKSKKFFRRGKRKKKLEVVQLYQCKECNRTFTSQFVKGKHYPMNLIIDGLSYYNLGWGLEDTGCNF